MDPNLIALGTSLAELSARNTFSFINTKMEEAKTKKTLEERSNMYSQIINDLLNDKLELERVASEYKDLYEKVTISDEDITYLQSTLENAVQILYKFAPQSDDTKHSIDTLIQLLNKDTLKTMQLIGFNYKEAIGQPLTEACANAISNQFRKNSTNKSMNRNNKK